MPVYKPLDEDMLHTILCTGMSVLTIEEAVLQGGFGSAVLEFAHDHQYHNAQIDRMGIPDKFIEHGSVSKLLEEIDLTTEKAVEKVQKLLEKQSIIKQQRA
ncbi:deoxyxylulose-5-phosphate synthase [Schinkia azotoformans MEV2011]|uniref:Deoxyxylulose-5-phosphate synthase n=1 Tax=Schinkia azotoformans MEV2011 TaxID=1348973 RepID=A0A072NKC9_SCHAZ|nr:deoxyxylulose-5-phosphate synthase [Schinkia azotoformans MEV2011]